MIDIKKNGHIDTDAICYITQKIMSEVAENKEAIMYCSREKKLYDYITTRAASFCSLLIAFAKDLGFSETEMAYIGMGGLLHDSGKLWLAKNLLYKTNRLNRDEQSYIQDHIKYTEIILARSGITNEYVWDIALKHHERYDGSGYPIGLKGKEIPFISQMATIVDVYDALTSKRSYKSALEPAHALKRLVHFQHKFNQHLVQQFIKTIGIYPIGSLVKLRTGVLGIVTAQTEELLYPELKIVYDSQNKRYITPTLNTLEMINNNKNIGKLTAVSPTKYRIQPGQYL